MLSGLFLAIAFAIGAVSGLYAWAPRVEFSFWLAAPGYWIIPALAEEAVFRGLLCPSVEIAALTARTMTLSALSLGAFILWHPFQFWLGLPHAQPVFADPVFLTIVAGLGGVCMALRARTGSLWPCVAVHGLLVIGWKGLLGG